MKGKQAVPHSELTCREFVGLIRGLREDQLSDVDRRLFLQHRAKCVPCSNYLKGYELTISVTKKISEDSRDCGETMMPKSLVSRILGHKVKRPSGS
jgi:hypothetical protein